MSLWLDAVLGTLAGILSSSLFVLVLFVGFCVALGLVKLRSSSGTWGASTMSVSSLVVMSAA